MILRAVQYTLCYIKIFDMRRFGVSVDQFGSMFLVLPNRSDGSFYSVSRVQPGHQPAELHHFRTIGRSDNAAFVATDIP